MKKKKQLLKSDFCEFEHFTAWKIGAAIIRWGAIFREIWYMLFDQHLDSWFHHLFYLYIMIGSTSCFIHRQIHREKGKIWVLVFEFYFVHSIHSVCTRSVTKKKSPHFLESSFYFIKNRTECVFYKVRTLRFLPTKWIHITVPVIGKVRP